MVKLERLKQLIQAELELCDSLSTPMVCRMNNPENYQQLESLIIDKVSKQGFTIGQAILEIEREYNINMID